MSPEPGIDYPGTGVGVLLFDEQGRIFAAQRGPRARNEQGAWEIPGGTLDFGRTLSETCVNEMKEEYGIDVLVTGQLGAFDHIIPAQDNAPLEHWTAVLFTAEIITGTPLIMEPHKCTAIGWFTLTELEKLPLSLITQENIRFLRQTRPDLH